MIYEHFWASFIKEKDKTEEIIMETALHLCQSAWKIFRQIKWAVGEYYCFTMESRFRYIQRKTKPNQQTHQQINYLMQLGRSAKMEEDLHISTSFINYSADNDSKAQTWSFASSLILLEVVIRDEWAKKEVVHDKINASEKKPNKTKMKLEESKNGNHTEQKYVSAKSKKRYNPVSVGSIPNTAPNGRLNVMSKNVELTQQKELLEQFSQKKISKPKVSYGKKSKK